MRAFPREPFSIGKEYYEAERGMSLHDYFTAKIMQGFCSNPAIFATNCQSGWSLVNATDEQLIGYARKLAGNMVEAQEAA